MNLKGKIAIVTGAASGIGKETVIELAKQGCIPVLVNNAGIMIVKLLHELTADEFNKQITVNFLSGVNFILAVAPLMKKQGKGVIINVASVGGRLVVPGTAD